MLPAALLRRRELANGLVWSWEDNDAPKKVYVESWIFSALFGEHGEWLSIFQRVLRVTISFQEDRRGGFLLLIYGLPFLRALAMILIVSMSVHLRMRRSQARAVQNSARASS